jgi:hypothetical protein
MVLVNWKPRCCLTLQLMQALLVGLMKLGYQVHFAYLQPCLPVTKETHKNVHESLFWLLNSLHCFILLTTHVPYWCSARYAMAVLSQWLPSPMFHIPSAHMKNHEVPVSCPLWWNLPFVASWHATSEGDYHFLSKAATLGWAYATSDHK